MTIDPGEYLWIADEAARKLPEAVADDMRSDGVIAIYELADGFTGGKNEFVKAASEACCKIGWRYFAERRNGPRTLNHDVAAPELDEPPSDFHRPTTAGQRRRWERNLVIAAAVRQGVSRRMVARVFGLASSRVQKIIKEYADYSS